MQALELVALPMRYEAPLTIWREKELAPIEGGNAQTIQDFETANLAFRPPLQPCAMSRLLATATANFQLLFKMAWSCGSRARPIQDHRLILQALRSRDADQACNPRAPHSTDRAANLPTGIW
ncbi:hypothetical protein [Bradyrhizobium shewense]|uniref:hypothetical protein n=1 Tax=Bradyrhizobium shewense TaxID=1761772 RepID=UPI00101ADD29|nr:hypothetical protein [Bradyrhizobium shewense]